MKSLELLQEVIFRIHALKGEFKPAIFERVLDERGILHHVLNHQNAQSLLDKPGIYSAA
jgi:hypothetical protein